MIKQLLFALLLVIVVVQANLYREDVKLPPLPYGYGALEPIIDTETMKLHHMAHHNTYTNNVNLALKTLRETQPDLLKVCKDVNELLRKVKKVKGKKMRNFIINNGGGYVNHDLFWKMMVPPSHAKPPSDKLIAELTKSFGSFTSFIEQFSDMARDKNTFGSGWVWLVKKGDKLKIRSKEFQDPPILRGEEPILGLDVWEHAYYLKHRQRRDNYIMTWWKVVNWEYVEELMNL